MPAVHILPNDVAVVQVQILIIQISYKNKNATCYNFGAPWLLTLNPRRIFLILPSCLILLEARAVGFVTALGGSFVFMFVYFGSVCL